MGFPKLHRRVRGGFLKMNTLQVAEDKGRVLGDLNAHSFLTGGSCYLHAKLVPAEDEADLALRSKSHIHDQK